MSKGISGNYKQHMDKPWLGEWDLPENDDLIVEIDYVDKEAVKSDQGTESKMTIHLKGGLKPMICNITNGDSIAMALGTPLVENWAGRKIQLYRESVRAFGKTTMAIRVRPFPPKEETYKCSECGCTIQQYGKLSPASIADRSQAAYGRVLCMECSKKAKAAQEAAEKEGDVLGDESNENKNS